jgi:hypothetical protein
VHNQSREAKNAEGHGLSSSPCMENAINALPHSFCLKLPPRTLRALEETFLPAR